MKEFTSKSYGKLKRVSPELIMDKVSPLMLEEENVLAVYKNLHDFCVFTNHRIITVTWQDVSGKKKFYTSLPYSKAEYFSVGAIDSMENESELCIYFKGIELVRFEFIGSSNLPEICEILSTFTL